MKGCEWPLVKLSSIVPILNVKIGHRVTDAVRRKKRNKQWYQRRESCYERAEEQCIKLEVMKRHLAES